MKWQDKEISELTNKELTDASFELNKLHNNMIVKRNHPKFLKKFNGQPSPETNPMFEQLQNEVKQEVEKRGLV